MGHGGNVGTTDIQRGVTDRERLAPTTLPRSGSFGEVALSLPTAGSLCCSPRGGTGLKVIQDSEFLVNRCDEHIHAEFRQFLTAIGSSAATIAAAGY